MSDFGDRLAGAFARLVELPADQRQSHLDELSASDAELATELASLLTAHDAEQSFLAPPDAVAMANLLDGDDRDQMPAQAGPWRLIRELGRGGLGVVYLAERSGGDFEQQAAVKLIKRGMDSEAILKRFEQERQLLATLDHPNIARLIDGGELEDGRPWFAMDFADGRPITQWCDQQRLSLRDRLILFGQVCRAVQAAHARLVVHRDLKPSNILVTTEGQVKLLDFGIAKLLASEQSLEPDLTRLGPAAMTPEYASPEQIEGQPVSVATDVYALGIVLYKLLCGRHPYRDQASTRESLQQAVRDSCPEQPSRSAARLDNANPSIAGLRPAALAKQLKGDLDAIVLTAMARQPENRYASVEALAEDLDRHLNGLPIRARARSRAYRVGRFLRRYRVGVSAVASVFLALSIGLGLALWQAREARHQALMAEQSREFVISLLTEIAPSTNPQGVDMPAVDLLLSAADRIESANDLAPLIQGRLAATIAEVLLELGSVDRALALAELGVERLRASSNRDLGLLANNYYVLSRVQINLGQTETSEASALQGIALIEQLIDPSDADRLTRIELLEMQARRLGDRFESGRAVSLRERALQDRIELFGPNHINVAAGHYNLATELRTAGDFQSAEHHDTEFGRIVEQIDSDHPLRARVFLGLGVSQSAQGRLVDAEASLVKAIEIARQHYGEASGLVSSSQAHLGHLRRLQSRFDEAHQLFADVAFQPELEQVSYMQAVASSWLGSITLTLGRPREAMEYFERTQRAMDALGNESHPQQLFAALGLALARLRAHDLTPDMARQDAVIDQLFNAGAGPSQLHGEGAELMAALLRDLGQNQAADQWEEQASALFASHFGPDHPRTRAVGRLYSPAGISDGLNN